MAQLLIKGHPTRGYEVIGILEMLGGKITDRELYGNVPHYGYYIHDLGYISLTHCSLLKNAIVFTLEEFLEKFPYKVGDKVVYENKKREITKMGWEERTNTVAYKLDDKLYCNVIAELQPYKEENMEEITDKAIAPVLTGEDLAYNRFGYKIPNGYEFDCIKNNEIIIKPKQPQYPKTYKECCDVLGLNTLDNDAQGYKGDLIIRFQELLIARDAYWKIAGEHMGLGKPWEPDNNNPDIDLYVIINIYNRAEKATYGYGFPQCVFAFPTKEMRDAFLENFKEHIKECISLL